MSQHSSTSSASSAIRRWLETTDFSINAAELVGELHMRSSPQEEISVSSPTMPAMTCQEHERQSITDMHIRHLTRLTTYFFDMHVILQQIRHDFYEFLSKTDGAVQLITENSELPGIDILDTLNATTTALMKTIMANISDISEFMDMLSGMRQTMEGGEQPAGTKQSTYWEPLSDARRWRIALSDDDVFETDNAHRKSPSSEYSAARENNDDVKEASLPADDAGSTAEAAGWYLTRPKQFHAFQDEDEDELEEFHPLSDNDGFQEEKTQGHLTPLNPSFSLAYHEDIDDFCSPRLYMSLPRNANTRSQSRRIVLNNLPGDTTTAQVLQSIRCYGGILSATLTNSLHKASNGDKTAMIELVYPEAADDIIPHFLGRKVAFLDSRGSKHHPKAYIVPTPSYFHAETHHALLYRGCTRALYMPNFPPGAIWPLLCALGITHVSHVQLSDQGHLTVELTSLFEAGRAERLIRRGHMVDYNASMHKMRHVPDSSQGTMRDMCRHGGGGATVDVPYIPPDTLQDTWAKAPYNTYVNAPFGCSLQTTPEPSRQNILPGEESSIAIAASEDEDRETFKQTAYRIIGSNMTLTRCRWSWMISAADDLKLLMANTLHDPDWADDWDEYFRSSGQVNLRTWEEYGTLAAHRRECAAAQGLGQGMVPTCEACAWGCGRLEEVPAAGSIGDLVCKPDEED